jgi:hypothetical protein
VKVLIRIIHNLYILTLRLYPTGFRLEFEEEMATVFGAAMVEASEQGFPALLACAFRELRDGISRVLGENWDEVQNRFRGYATQMSRGNPLSIGTFKENRTMSESVRFGEYFEKDRRLAYVAALPPLLFGLGVAADSLIRGGPWNTIPTWRLYLSVGVGLFPMLIIAVVGLYALAKRMPDWGLTWIGSGFMGFVLLVKTASEELADVERFIVSQWVDVILMVVILLAGFVILAYAAVKGWRRAALFSIGMSGVFCLSLYLSVTSAPFYRHDLALISAPVGLFLSLLTYGYVVGSDQIRVLTFLGVALINLSPVLVTNQVWNDWLTSENKPSLSLPLLVLTTAILLSGPAMGLILKPLRRILSKPSA